MEAQFNFEQFADTLQRYRLPRAPLRSTGCNAKYEPQSGPSQIRHDSGRGMDSVCSSHGNMSTMQVREGYGREKSALEDGSPNQDPTNTPAAAHALPQNTDAPATKQIRRTATMCRTVTEIRHNIARNILMSRDGGRKVEDERLQHCPNTSGNGVQQNAQNKQAGDSGSDIEGLGSRHQKNKLQLTRPRLREGWTKGGSKAY